MFPSFVSLAETQGLDGVFGSAGTSRGINLKKLHVILNEYGKSEEYFVGERATWTDNVVAPFGDNKVWAKATKVLVATATGLLTHGHEDHVGGLSYLLREASFPLFGSQLTLGLARGRIEESGLLGRTELCVAEDGDTWEIGPFEVEFIPATHSVPQAVATAFHTPQGTIVHSGDFKIDLTPVDGRLTNLARLGALADGDGVRLLLADSTNADQRGHSRSETEVGRVLHQLMYEQRGRRVIVACFASHIHRIQQLANAAVESGRVIAPLGRSMRRNISMAREMGLLRIPDSALIDVDSVDRHPPGKVMVLCTGSQGEPLSALTLLAGQENRWLKLHPDDTVILSSHPIPGNEHAVTKVIDNLFRQGVEVIHSGVSDVHATGHAKAEELKTVLSIVQPEWFTPVHGEYRHLVAHAAIARQMGVADDHVNLCEDGDQLVITDAGIRLGNRIPAGYLYVDGSGIGDIGGGVLRDRRVLAEDGIVVVLATVDLQEHEVLGEPEVITKGWVHEGESVDLIEGCGRAVNQALTKALAKTASADIESLQKVVRQAAGNYVSDQTRRRPMIVPLVIEV